MDGPGEALISESFARKNLDTDAMEEAAGEAINISGRNYTIAGVYKIPDRYGASVKESAIEQVYLFSEPMEEIQGASCKILFSPCDNASNVFFEEELREYFTENVGYMDNIYIDDYTDYSIIISQFQRGMVFISEFLLFIFFSVVFVRRLRLYGAELKNRLKFQYMNEILSENVSSILIELIKLIMLLFICIFLLQHIIDFQFKIPGRLLPIENIFDFEFYRELILSFREHPVANLYEYMYRSALKVSELCLTAYIFLATAGLVFALKIKNRKTAESL